MSHYIWRYVYREILYPRSVSRLREPRGFPVVDPTRTSRTKLTGAKQTSPPWRAPARARRVLALLKQRDARTPESCVAITRKNPFLRCRAATAAYGRTEILNSIISRPGVPREIRDRNNAAQRSVRVRSVGHRTRWNFADEAFYRE